MLKIPTFILGGLLILTGLGSYLLQDLGLSIKLSGPLAENAKLTLSDGDESHELDLGYPSSKAAGEQAYWLIERLNTIYSIEASQSNFNADQSSEGGEKKSFWYASSRKETMAALMVDAANYKNANEPDFKSTPIKWEEVDVNSSTVKFVYKNEAGNSGPVTLKVSDWTNIKMEIPPEDNTLQFGKSLTALIPGAIGLVLILLVLAAESKPSLRKHIMHVAVVFGLLGFVMVAKQVGSAVSEMNWLRDEPNGIIQASILKPTAMLISAGLLLIFVILCIVSFVKARKEMAIQAKIEKVKAKEEKKVEDEFQDEDDEPTSKDSKEKKEPKEDRKEEAGKKDIHKKDEAEPKKSKPSEDSETPSKTKDFSDSKSKGSPDSESPDSTKGKSSSESDEEEKSDPKREDSVSKEDNPVESTKGKASPSGKDEPPTPSEQKPNGNEGSSPDPADKPKGNAKDSPNHSKDATGTDSPSTSGKDRDQAPENEPEDYSVDESDQESEGEENSSDDKPKDE